MDSYCKAWIYSWPSAAFPHIGRGCNEGKKLKIPNLERSPRNDPVKGDNIKDKSIYMMYLGDDNKRNKEVGLP